MNTNTEKSRKWRKANPEKYSYINLKSNAKRRGKEFSLTFEQFKKFCYKYEYFANAGRSKDGYTIDRINENEGYNIDNVQVLKNSENVKKFRKWKYKDIDGRNCFRVEEGLRNIEQGDCPF